MRQNVDTKVPLKEKHRSKYNQHSIKEVKIGVLGSGKTFGDIDAYKKRGYMYTLRTASSKVLLYEIYASDFMNLLKGQGGKESEFKRW